MLDIFIETLIDNLKLFPFLFAAYLLLEYLEHKASPRTLEWVAKSEKKGAFFGALCGIIPQCGFSAAAANFYAARIITRGTLIAIFLSTSDEMLPIMLAQSMPLNIIIAIIGYKFAFGLICGLLIDFCRKQKPLNADIKTLCHEANCPCEEADSLVKAAFFHSFNITIFIFIVSLILNFSIEVLPFSLSSLHFLQMPLLAELSGAFFGLIPNCSPSVILTQLYIEGGINLSTMLSGTLTGSGVGLLILFKVNRKLKENLKILALLYILGVSGGLISNLFSVFS